MRVEKAERDYLKYHYPEGIPSNCVLNKVVCGCGATSWEIENMNRDSIIAVPVLEMIDNKVGQYPNERTPTDFKLFGVKGGVTKDDVKEYLKANRIHKIIVVYDSLYKVVEAINELQGRKIEDYFLLVDEVHYIMNNYKLRKKAFHEVLTLRNQFSNVTYVTATPNEPEFTLSELEGIRIEIAPFELEAVHITNNATPQVEATTKKYIEDYLNNRLQNAHIFVNSVEIIASLIKACGLTNDNCKAVWSKWNKSYKTHIAGIKRSDVGDPAKKINFYTSTCFEGSDVLDQEGQYIIVSDGKLAYTQMDIKTSVRQIVGRIRNTKYRSEVLHIFNKTRYSECATYDEYKAITVLLENDAVELVRTYNKLKKRTFTEEQLNDIYITKIGEEYEVDRNLIKCDLMGYKRANETYSSIAILASEQNRAGFQVTNSIYKLEPTDYLKRNPKAKNKFDDTFRQYVELKKFKFTTNPLHWERVEMIQADYPFIEDAFTLLGDDTVRNLEYNQTAIKRKLISLSDSSSENRIAKMLIQSGVFRNTFVPSKTLKGIIKKVYETANIDKQPKASDINKYFETTETSKRIDGAVVQGYRIIREKFIFKNSPENELQDSFKRIELKVNTLSEKLA